QSGHSAYRPGSGALSRERTIGDRVAGSAPTEWAGCRSSGATRRSRCQVQTPPERPALHSPQRGRRLSIRTANEGRPILINRQSPELQTPPTESTKKLDNA